MVLLSNYDKLKKCLYEDYRLLYNTNKTNNNYHEKGLQYFENNRNAVNNIIKRIELKYKKINKFNKVLLIEGENIFYNFNKSKHSDLDGGFHPETPMLIRESLDLYNDYFIVIFCQEHNKNIYDIVKTFADSIGKLLPNQIEIVSSPSQSEIDDILLFLTFKHFYNEKIPVYVRSSDNMNWARPVSLSTTKQSSDQALIYKALQDNNISNNQKRKNDGRGKSKKNPAKKPTKKPTKKPAKKPTKKYKKYKK